MLTYFSLVFLVYSLQYFNASLLSHQLLLMQFHAGITGDEIARIEAVQNKSFVEDNSSQFSPF